MKIDLNDQKLPRKSPKIGKIGRKRRIIDQKYEKNCQKTLKI